MSLLSDNVRVGGGVAGELYHAPTGTTAPTSSSSSLSSWTGLGYVSEDGVEEEYNDTIEDITAWQGATVVRSTTTESKATLHCTLIETKGEVLELFHKGSTVEVVSAGEWKMDVLAPSSDVRSFVLDVVDDTKHIRIYVPRGEVTERGTITYSNSDAVGYEITITAYPVDGVVLTKFSNDAAWGYS